jgi:hypothetical protein
MRSLILSVLLLFICVTVGMAGTTGKIVGTVTDARTGEKLISANIVIVGRSIGASTNVDGYFVILNVPPGKYMLRASLVGFRTTTVSDVSVEIDLTTEVPIRLTEEAVQGEEVTVVAQRPVIQKDLSASSANISAVDVALLPTASVSTVVALQAGIERNANGELVIRGGGADQTLFLLDGQSLRDGRTNKAFTQISLSSIDNLQITTGGWNAEYGNVRSGLVNAVTKEGNASAYSISVTTRYSPAQPKHFGSSIYDLSSYFIRPFVDPAVAFTGTTSGAWDAYTRKQYQDFEGWNSISQKTLADNDPTNDLTPEAAQRLFLWEHRRQVEISKDDYDIDAGFGGPFPFVSQYLGDLRFFASYRQSRNAYVIPLSRDSYDDYVGQLKLTSDVGSNMKLMVEGLISRGEGTTNNNTGSDGVFSSPSSIANLVDRVSYIDGRIFGTDYWAPTVIKGNMVGAKFSHVINPSTFYSVSFHRYQTKYDTNPDRERNTAKVYKFGNSYYVDEAPYGFQPLPSNGIGSGMRMGVGMSNSRDSSVVATYNLRGDFTNQFDQHNQFQGGFEFVYTDNNVNYRSVDTYLPSGRSASVWHTFPKQGAAYLQDKLEYAGMVANLGVRLDYSYAGGSWYRYGPYDKAFSGTLSFGIDTAFQKIPTEKIITFSPRVGIAFPITEYSKIFFNYGHFRSLPFPENLFLIRRESLAGSIVRLANPNNPLPKTVSYELGYEHSILDQFLIRVAGYYKDVTQETKLVEYISKNGQVDYQVSTSNLYEDIRGFEVTLSRNRGSWVQGFVNYTYDVNTSGYFGREKYYENPVTMRDEEKTNVSQDKPVAQPYGRANINFRTPEDLGPIIGDFQLNVVGSYSAGSHFTWGGGGGAAPVSARNNVQWTDSWNIDLRFSKNFTFDKLNLQLFIDVSNALNFKRMSHYGFFNGQDFDDYMKSLHLAEGIAGNELEPRFGYLNFPGDDKPGDYRRGGVFTPMVSVANLGSVTVPAPSAFYNDRSSGRWVQYVGGNWVDVSSDRLQQVLDDKAYIDMPNLETFTFLNPRDFFYGIRVSFEF